MHPASAYLCESGAGLHGLLLGTFRFNTEIDDAIALLDMGSSHPIRHPLPLDLVSVDRVDVEWDLFLFSNFTVVVESFSR